MTSRRTFLNNAGVALGAGVLSRCTTPAPAKPNVVLVITDDQGYGDLGCHGNPIIRTPAVDRFHAESVRFTDFHVDPLCAPTRAGLLTGQYAYRGGVTAAFGGRSILRPEATTIAEICQRNGYRTGLFGKWHLGDNFPCRPNERGFDETVACWSGGVTQAADHWGNDYFDDTYSRNNVPEKFDGYCTDVFFREAIQFIETNRDRPFFVFLPTNAPHAPYLVDAKYSAPYEEQGLHPTMAAFYGMIKNLDENFDRLRRRLDDLGLADNTILIFMTDNGTAAGAGERVASETWAGDDAGMRGRKASQYEGGHRVPFFVSWPAGGIGGGRDVGELAAHIDVAPTLVELAGLETAQPPGFDGVSLAPLLRGEDGFPAERVHFTQHQQFRHDGVFQMDKPQPWLHSAAMTGRWRLIDGAELYDLDADPGQERDVAGEHPDVVARLRAAYEAWWSEVSGPAAEYVRIVVGDDRENPALLTSFDWRPDGGPPNQDVIREPPESYFWGDNGFWALTVAHTGRYAIRLRERPPEADYPIDATRARVRIAGQEAEHPLPPQAQEAAFELELQAGETRLETWFEKDGAEPRGAYYAYIERLA